MSTVLNDDLRFLDIIKSVKNITEAERSDKLFISKLFQFIKSSMFTSEVKFSEFLDFTYSFIQLPIDRNLDYEEIFLFLISTIESNKETIENIANTAFDSLSADDVLFLVDTCASYKSLIKKISSVEFFTEERVQKIIDSSSVNKRNSTQIDFFAKILIKYLNPDIFRLLFARLDSSSVECMFIALIMENYAIFPSLFQQSHSLDIVLEKINDTSFLNSFIQFWGTLNQYTHDYFIDEWLINLPIDLPIFKVSPNLVYVYGPNNEAILQPSLLPFKKVDVKLSPFNLFLMGHFSLPIYHKLGVKYENIPYIKEIVNYYISPFDIMNIIHENPTFINGIIKDKQSTSLFQLTNDITPPSIEINEKCSTFSVNIKFLSFFTSKYTFLCINNREFYIENNVIYDNKNNKLIEIYCSEDQWLSLIFLGKKSQISIFLNGSCIYTYDDLVPFTVNYIGNIHMHPPIRIHVASNIICDENPWSIEKIQSQANYLSNMPPNVPIKCSQSVFYATYLPISKTLSDSEFIHKILLEYENSGKTDFLDLLPQISSLPTTDLQFLYSNYLYSMFNSVTKISVDKIKFYLNSIFSLQNYDMKSFLVGNFLNSPYLLNLEENDLSQVLNALYSILRNNIHNLNISYFCTKQIIRIFYQFIFVIKKDSKCILQFFTLFLTASNSHELLQDIVNLIKITPYFNPFSTPSAVINSNFEKNNEEIQIKLLSIVMDKLNEVDFNSLMEMALLISPDVSLTIASVIFHRATKDNAMKYLPVIIKYSTQFVDRIEFWEMVLSQITGTIFSLVSNEAQSNDVQSPFLLPVLLEMLICISDKEKSFYAQIYNLSKPLFIRYVQIISMNAFKPYIVDAISRKVLKMNTEPNVNVDEDTDISNHMIAWLERERSLDSINEYQDDDFNIIGREVNEKKTTYLYNTLLADLIAEIFYKNQNDMSYISYLINYGSTEIVTYTTIKIFIKFSNHNFNNSVAQKIVRLCYAVNCNHPNTLKSSNFFENLLMMLQTYTAAVQEFLPFFIRNILFMPPETVDLLLTMVSKHLNPKGNYPIFLFLFFISLLKSGIPSDLEFIVHFYNAIKKFAKKNNLQLYKSVINSKDVNTIQFTEEELSKLKDFNENYLPFVQTVVNNLPKQYPERDHFLTFMFNYHLDLVRCQINFHREFSLNLDVKIRELENFETHRKSFLETLENQNQTSEKLNQNSESFHVSPFFSAKSAPSIVIPSKFELHPPNVSEQQQNMQKEKIKNFVVQQQFSAMWRTNYSQFSISFSGDVRSQIEMIYHPQAMMNATLVRLFVRIPCVSFISQRKLMLLTNASLDSNSIILHESKTVQWEYFLERVQEFDFGSNYTNFIGHPLLIISEIAECYEYFTNSFEIYSATNGVFIVEFSSKMPLLSGMPRMISQQEQDLWFQGEMSNKNYLLLLNHSAKRCFVDCSNYPIFPRIIWNVNEDSIRLRDLSLPIQAATDPDKEHNGIIQLYEMQNYHYGENISNMQFVSSLLIRLSPFCNIQWDVNGQWDSLSRGFNDVTAHLSCNPRTSHELIPEVYFFPEIFENLNNFVFPDGQRMDIVFPKFAKCGADVVKVFTSFLNCDTVRDKLNDWIDLVFGYKLSNDEAVKSLNTFHPNSYRLKPDDDADNEKIEWRLACGEVPQQIFTSPHKKSTKVYQNATKYTDCEMKYDPFSSIVTINNTKYITGLSFANHVSSDGKVLVVTSNIGCVYAFTIPRLRLINKLCRQGSIFSKVCSECMLCVTAFYDCVIFWLISNGRIIKIIDIDRPQSILIEKESHYVLIQHLHGTIKCTASGLVIH